jgi:multidrug resistance protein, MATE family
MNDHTAASPWRRDLDQIARLGAPLLVNNLAVAGMGLADTLMAGRLGAQALAIVAVGVTYYNLFFVTGLGVLMAVAPTVAHVYGGGGTLAVGRYLRQALWLAVVLALVLTLGLSLAGPLLRFIGTDPSLIEGAAAYVRAISLGLPGLLGFFAIRFTCEGLGLTRPIMATAVLGLLVNVAGNWVFMYGKLGAPALGPVGTGVASAVTMWTMFVILALATARGRRFRPYQLYARFEWPRLGSQRELLALGIPICGSLLFESGLFVGVGLMMSTLGARVVAAHQIALNFAIFMFMAPLAMHSATTIHVGHAIGRGDAAGGRRAGLVGIGLCGALMACSALLILIAHRGIARLYTDDAGVLALASQLLLMAGLFQISDGLQVGAHGALRGYKDARVPMVLAFVCYWLVGFPLAWGLGIHRGLGPIYVWGGLIAGLTLSALALNVRFLWVARRALRR